MNCRGVYTLLHKRIAVSTAITIMQLKAGTNRGFEILRIWCTQTLATTADQETLSIVRKTVAATVTAAIVGTTLFKHDPNDGTPDLSLATSGTGITASAEGTDGDILWSEGFDVINGLLYLPTEKERIWVPPAGIIGIKFEVAPTSHTWTAGVTIREN